MYKCIDHGIDFDKFDNTPFKFSHKILNHPTLSIENLAKVLPRMPKGHVKYSKGFDHVGGDFDNAENTHKNNLTLEETIENIKTSNSYIAVHSAEVDPSFKELYEDLIADAQTMMKLKGVGKKALVPKIFLFIASPGAYTPFHLDRHTTFLFQLRGKKEVAVFPQFNPKVVDPKQREAYADYSSYELTWDDEMDQYAYKFDFSPGEGIHIPFIGGHYVKNGTDDVSISMSIIFRTKQSQRWLDAMGFNNRLRKHFAKIGIQLKAVGTKGSMDRLKAFIYPFLDRLQNLRSA